MRRLLAAALIACLAAGVARADQGSIQLVAGGALVSATNPLPVTIPSGSLILVNLTEIGGNSVVTGGVNGSLGVGGLAASGSSLAGSPLLTGCAFNTTQPTVTTGQAVDLQCTARGAAILATGIDPFIVQQGTAAALSGAWPLKLTDGTNVAAVKAGSTAAAAADPSAVIALSPNSPLPAGSAIVGKVGIDQTTDVTTNGFEIAPTAGAAAGITSVVSASAEATHVLKGSAGNLYSVYVTNLTATAGFLVVLNATTAPADGAITPLDCVPLPANSNASIGYRPGPAKVYSTGITAVVTSATTCFTKTTGVITAFFSGDVK